MPEDITVECSSNEEGTCVTLKVMSQSKPLTNGQFFTALLQIADRLTKDLDKKEDTCGDQEKA